MLYCVLGDQRDGFGIRNLATEIPAGYVLSELARLMASNSAAEETPMARSISSSDKACFLVAVAAVIVSPFLSSAVAMRGIDQMRASSSRFDDSISLKS